MLLLGSNAPASAGCPRGGVPRLPAVAQLGDGSGLAVGDEDGVVAEPFAPCGSCATVPSSVPCLAPPRRAARRRRARTRSAHAGRPRPRARRAAPPRRRPPSAPTRRPAGRRARRPRSPSPRPGPSRRLQGRGRSAPWRRRSRSRTRPSPAGRTPRRAGRAPRPVARRAALPACARSARRVAPSVGPPHAADLVQLGQPRCDG